MAKKRHKKRNKKRKRRGQPPIGPRQEHDPSYKGFFSTTRMVRDLLLGFLTGAWLETLDLDSLQLAPASYVGRRNRQRHNDVVWRLKSKHSGNWVYVYLMIEFQSSPYKFMAIRVLTYLGLFYETLIRRDKSLEKRGALLPAVLPIVIYNGKPRWGWPRKLSDLIEPLPEEYREYQPECAFVLLDEGRFKEEDLETRVRNLVAILFRLENTRLDQDLRDKIRILNEELERSGTPELERVFDRWLNRVMKMRFPAADFGELRGQEKRSMLSETIGEWIEDAETRGIEKGRQEGIQDVILGQLEHRFGAIPAALASEIRKLNSPSKLQRIARQIVVIRSLDELKIA